VTGSGQNSSRSWGHTISAGPRRYADGRPFECSTPRCKEPAVAVGTYSYVTGRAGRVSYARRDLCDTHAQRFREKYEPQEIAATPSHALEVAVSQVNRSAS
jgi:hypothetical protein